MYGEWLKLLRVAAWFGCLMAAVVSDHKTRKISNRLILTGIVLATVLSALEGLQAFWNAFAGGTVALFVGFILWKFRVFRAGDAKLLWMTMQFAGWEEWTWHMSTILLTGGVFAAFILLRQGIFVQRIRRMGVYLYNMVLMGQYTPYEPVPEDKGQFPFADAVFVGELVACLTLYLS